MKRLIGVGLLASLVGCESSPTDSGLTWQASRQSDPVTGVTRCVVTAPDRGLGSSYTRTSYLYPFVESNSEAGLLVGVSSGGKVRVPPGDVVWRVDQNSLRTLTMAGTPVIGTPTNVIDTSSFAPEQKQAFEAAMASTAGMTSSIQNGITAAGGSQAEELLAEMRAGQSLLFRSTTAAPGAGVPRSASYNVGQITKDGIKPIPLDESFEAALAECGI